MAHSRQDDEAKGPAGEKPRVRLRSLPDMIVYLLQHVHHLAEDEHGNVLHHEENGDVSFNEEDGDNVKILGIYSSEAKAEERIARARLDEGFRDEPDCFHVAEYELDHDQWVGGFFTYSYE
jgi:hypothetical protein